MKGTRVYQCMQYQKLIFVKVNKGIYILDKDIYMLTSSLNPNIVKTVGLNKKSFNKQQGHENQFKREYQ